LTHAVRLRQDGQVSCPCGLAKTRCGPRGRFDLRYIDSMGNKLPILQTVVTVGLIYAGKKAVGALLVWSGVGVVPGAALLVF